MLYEELTKSNGVKAIGIVNGLSQLLQMLKQVLEAHSMLSNS